MSQEDRKLGLSCSDRRGFLRSVGATAIATTGLATLSGQAAAETINVDQKKTNSTTFDGYDRQTQTNFDGGTSLTVNKREYESTTNYVTYRFDITGTFECITNDNEPWVDTLGYRFDFDKYDDETPVTADLIDNPESSERVRSGINLSDGNYDAGDATEAAIEVIIEELLATAAFVSSSYVTVGSLMYALFQGVDTGMSNNNGEVIFNDNWGESYKKRVDIGYHGLEFTLDPNKTDGVTFEGFTNYKGYSSDDSTPTVHFELDDHL